MKESLEPKKLALLRILQILDQYTCPDHPLTQDDIAARLAGDYGIELERKAIGRNLSLLKEAGYDIESDRRGSYLASREFDDSELRMLIDGVLASKYITARHSKELIEKLCSLSDRHFRAHVKNIWSVNEWSKTDNCAVFYNIEVADAAIERGRQIEFVYNKYGADKKLHRTAKHLVSPYQFILHNQRYYLVACNEKWKNIGHYRLDRITDIRMTDEPATPLRSLPGYEKGIDYKQYATSLPYMFARNGGVRRRSRYCGSDRRLVRRQRAHRKIGRQAESHRQGQSLCHEILGNAVSQPRRGAVAGVAALRDRG